MHFFVTYFYFSHFPSILHIGFRFIKFACPLEIRKTLNIYKGMMILKQVAIIGGDARYERMLSYFTDVQWNIHTIGLSVPHQEYIQAYENIQQIPLQDMQIILLPIQGISSEGNVQTNNGMLTINQKLWKSVSPDCIIFTGMMTDYLQHIKTTFNLSVVPLFNTDDIAIYNAVPTAEGTLQIAMEQTETTIFDMPVLVFGFGRVGQTIASLFHAVGAKVTVVTNDDAELARATVCHLQVRRLEEEIPFHLFHVIINTIPAPIITKNRLKKTNRNVCIIDIASAPGGIDASTKKACKRKIITAPGLPSKVAIQSASKIIADAIIRRVNLN